MAIWTGMRGAGRASKPPSRARRSTRNGTVFAVYVDGPEKSGALFGEQTSMFRDLTSLGKELDVDVTVLTPGYARTRNGWRWDESGARWESVAMAYPDVVIRRSGSFRHASPRTVQADLRHFASAQRLHTLPREISNKWTFYQKMNDHASIRHALPHTHVANGPEHVLRALSRYEDVYLKPLNGAQGVGVVRVMVEDGEPVALYEQRIPPPVKGVRRFG
ncbi:hypothetical protein GCM10025857_02550 [Alicyclobacillus contaminans]|nr:hypothetical protein GCM10025857_02550 [Alicyclobacillus contaminans]